MASTKDFLFEIGTEEMPSAPLINASKQPVSYTHLTLPTNSLV